MQSLQDIIGRKNFDQPPEIEIIKTFVRKKFNSDIKVTVNSHNITITVPSAALAGSLRSQLHHLKKDLDSKKKLFIRIGN